MKKCKSIAVLLITFIIIIISTCQPSGGGGDGGGDGALSKIDIVNATSLFIAPSGSKNQNINKQEGINRLFKITDEGYLEEVTYYNDLGEVIITVEYIPTQICNVNELYVIIVFNNSSGYLVRKNDGAVFSLDNVGLPRMEEDWGTFKNVCKVQTDSLGNIYYVRFTGTTEGLVLKKLNVTDPESIVATSYTPDVDNVLGFAVTPDGHVAYVYGDGSKNRIKKSNGGLYNLPDGGWKALWIGLDGKIKYQNEVNANTINTVNIDASFNVTITSVTGSGLQWIPSIYSYLLRMGSKVYIIDVLNGSIFEVENPTDSPRRLFFSEIDKIDIAALSDNYYYLSGSDSFNNPVLIKIDPSTDNVTTQIKR